MIVETGHYALVLALALALAQFAIPFIGARLNDAALMRVARPAAITQFLFVALSYGALTYAHVVSDFSLVNVIENSHSLKPFIYKISGVWGNHEGSMLLWVLVLSFCGALIAVFSNAMPDRLRADALAVQGLLGAAFLLFILLTSNPFARVAPAPWEGRDLNPILQDPGLAIHPPLLYLGYVGFSIVFSFAAAALIGGRIDAGWARVIRPWTLFAWIALTLGIAMGSYWAYYTLGWGGFWFWDPVENASLMPWIAGTALVHSAAVMEKREALKVWTIFLAILAFSLSLLGTFLVRSGVLTSVHAFASDPDRGVFILAILVFFIGGALALFALRAGALPVGGLFSPISREGALVLNNLLLSACCATVVVGTLYPLALEAITGEKISVGAPFFNTVLVPIALPLALLMPIGQMLAWKRGDLAAALQRLRIAFIVGVVATAAFGAWYGTPFLSDRYRRHRDLSRRRRFERSRAARAGDLGTREPEAARRPAAVRLRHVDRSRRHGADAARPRRDRLGRRNHRRDEACELLRRRSLSDRHRLRFAAPGAELFGSLCGDGGAQGRRDARDDRTGQALLSGAAHGALGGGHRHARARPGLCGDRRVA